MNRMGHANDRLLLMGSLIIGSVLMGVYIYRGGEDWKVFAVIGCVVLGIARGRQWFNVLIEYFRAKGGNDDKGTSSSG